MAGAVVLGVVAISYLVAAYWPLRWQRPYVTNTVEVSRNGTLAFDGTGIATSDAPLPWMEPAVDGGEIVVDLQARTGDADQRGPARLLTVAADHRHANLSLAQRGDDLIVRVRRPGSNDVGSPPIVVAGVFADDVWRHIRFRVADGLATVEVDGVVAVEELVGQDAFRSWDTGLGLALGNEQTKERGWSGQIRQAVVEAGGVSVDHLDPSSYRVPSSWLRKPIFATVIEASDVAINFVGFAPFGALVVLLRPLRCPLLGALGASLMLSTAMEAGQLAVVGRDPSILDVAVNVAGGVAGGSLAVLYLVRRRPSRHAARGER